MKRYFSIYFLIFFLLFYINSFSSLNIERLLFERTFVKNHSITNIKQAASYSVGQSEKFNILTPENTYKNIDAVCREMGDYFYIFVENGKELDELKLKTILNSLERDGGIRTRLTERFGYEFNDNGGVDGDNRIFLLIGDMGDFNSVSYGDFSDDGEYDSNGNEIYPIDCYYSYLDELSSSKYPYSNEKEIIYLNINYMMYWRDSNIGINPPLNAISREYFRMIHFNQEFLKGSNNTDLNAIEDIWMDYGLAVYLEEYATGHFDDKYITSVRNKPSNSLIMFEESLGNLSLSERDTGMAALFFMYLEQRVKEWTNNTDIIKELVVDEQNGIVSLENNIKKIKDVDFTSILSDFHKALYLNSADMPSEYKLYGLDMKASKTNIRGLELFESENEDIIISPSIKLQNKSTLRMGGNKAYNIIDKVWPDKNISIKFFDLKELDKIKISFLLLKEGEIVKEDTYEINLNNNIITWNNIYTRADDLVIVLSDISNDCNDTGDYKFPYYTEVLGSTSSTGDYVNKLSSYMDYVGKQFEIKIIDPEEPRVSLMPSPFIPDFVYFNIEVDGDVEVNLQKPDGSVEVLTMNRLGDLVSRYGCSFKVEQTGEYTAEVSVYYFNGMIAKKNYTFSIIDFLSGKNIIIDNVNYSSAKLLYSVSKTPSFLIKKDNDGGINIDPMDGKEFELELSFANEPDAGIYMKTSDGIKLLDYYVDGNDIKTVINKAGLYYKIIDNIGPDIKIDKIEDRFIEFTVDDISLKTVKVFDQKGDIVHSSSAKINKVYIDNDVEAVNIIARDKFDNSVNTLVKIPRKVSSLVSFVKIYPNPAESFVNFEFQSSSTNTVLKIYDASGKLIKKADKYEIDHNGSTHKYLWLLEDNRLKQVSNGIYFYRLIIDGDEKNSGKIVVLR